MTELLNCPFCKDGEPKTQVYEGGLINTHYIECRECGARTRLCVTNAEAVTTWNMRTSPWRSFHRRLTKNEP